MSGTKCTLFCLKREKELASFRDAGTMGAGGAYAPQILMDQLTLYQPGGQIMPPSAFKTFWHPWLAFAYERTQKSKAKRRKLKKFISINLQWLSFFSVLSSLFQFLFFSPSLSPSAFCSRSSALCNITIGWNHFWGIFSFFCLRFSSNLVQITEWNQSM